MFNKAIKKYSDKRLLRYFQTQDRYIKINTLKNSKNIGILWNPDDEDSLEAYELFRKTLQSRAIKPNGLAQVFLNREIELLATITNSDFLMKSDIGIFGRPKKSSVEHFISEPFDILIDLTIAKRNALLYALVHSKATFKVGYQASEPNFYDMHIDVSENPNCKYLLEQVIYYLENIND
jgi:hypothetical protein